MAGALTFITTVLCGIGAHLQGPLLISWSFGRPTAYYVKCRQIPAILNSRSLTIHKSRWHKEANRSPEIDSSTVDLFSTCRGRRMVRVPRQLTSSVLCQHKDRAHSQVYVLIHEYRIEDPLHARSVTEHAHRTCSSPYLPEPSLDGVGCPDRFAEVCVGELKTGEQVLEVIPETLHRFRVFVGP